MQPPRGFCYAQYTQQFPNLLHTVRKVLGILPNATDDAIAKLYVT